MSDGYSTIKRPIVIYSEVKYHEDGEFIVIDEDINPYINLLDLIELQLDEGYQLKIIDNRIITQERVSQSSINLYQDLPINNSYFNVNVEDSLELEHKNNSIRCADYEVAEIGEFIITSKFFLISDRSFDGYILDQLFLGKWKAFFTFVPTDFGTQNIISIFLTHSELDDTTFEGTFVKELQILGEHICLLNLEDKEMLDIYLSNNKIPYSPFIFNNSSVIAKCETSSVDVFVLRDGKYVSGIKVNYYTRSLCHESFL